MYKKDISYALVGFLFSLFEFAFAEENVIVSGFVYDNSSNQSIEGVRVVVEEADEVPTSLTNKSGKYTLVISGRTEARITFSKDGYKPVTTLVKLSEPTLKHDVKMEIMKITIEMTKFTSGSYIEGKVSGLDAADLKKSKILVYVLTDKWYIHPYADNRAGRGFAEIDNQGNWRIETERRNFQAFKVAFLLVPRDFYPPPSVELVRGKSPEVSLLSEIPPKAEKIIPAPDGI